MKKILLVVLVVIFTSFLCFAQQVSAQVNQTAQASAATKTLTITGRVDSIIIGDSAKGIKSELAIVGDYGKNISFSASDETSITNKDEKVIAISNLNKGDKVNIVYTIGKKGINRAQSIKLVE